VNDQLTFGGVNGTPPFTFSLVTNGSGGSVDSTTGVYTAGASPGIDVIRVTDAAFSAADAAVTVTSAATVTTSLDPRVFETFGARIVDLVVTAGDAVFSAIPTDQVRDLPLQQGTTYTLLGVTSGGNPVSFHLIVDGECALTVVP